MHACASSIIGGRPSRTVRGTSRRIRPSGWPIERRWPIEAVLGRWPIESECEFLSNCRAGPHEPLVSRALSLSLSPSGRGTIQHLNLSVSPLRNFGLVRALVPMGDPPKPPDASSLPMPKFMRPRPDPSPFLAPTNAGPAPTNAARRKGSVVSSHDGQSEVPALVMRDAVQGLKPALPTCLLPACMLPTYLPTCLLLPRTWRGSRWRTV
jgi:hypothetical protein